MGRVRHRHDRARPRHVPAGRARSDATRSRGGGSSSCSSRPRTPACSWPQTRSGATTAGCSRWLLRPQELLLAELGRASRVYPGLIDGLRSALPERPRPRRRRRLPVPVHRRTAARRGRLRRPAAVVVGPTPQARARPVRQHPGRRDRRRAVKFGRAQLVDFRWELAVGEDTLTDDEIAALAQAKAPLIRLRGQWVAVDTDQLRRGLEFLEREATGQMTAAAEVLALASSHPDDLDTPLEVTAVRADGWLGDLLDGSRRRVAGAGHTAGRVHRDTAALPGAGPVVVDVPVLARAGQLPRRRHGSRQDRPAARDGIRTAATGPGHRTDAAAVPDVAGRQLAARGGEVRARAAGLRAPRGRRGCAATACANSSSTSTWSSPPTPPRPATSTNWSNSTGTGWFSTRRRPSRTACRAPRRRCAGCGPATGSR